MPHNFTVQDVLIIFNIPTEILYEIVNRLVAEYVDEVLIEYAVPSEEFSKMTPPSRQDAILTSTWQTSCYALLQTSRQVHQITLTVLSQALVVGYDSTGVERLEKPFADYLHSARCDLWKLHSSNETTRNSFLKSPYRPSSVINAYMVLASLQYRRATASTLSFVFMFSMQFEPIRYQEVFDIAKQLYIELLSGSYLSCTPGAFRNIVHSHTFDAALGLLAGVSSRLNFSLRQLHLVEAYSRITGRALEVVYEDAVQGIGQLTGIMKSLYDLELNVPSSEIASHARTLRECSMNTCYTLCDFTTTVNGFEARQNELQDKAGLLRDIIASQLDTLKPQARASEIVLQNADGTRNARLDPTVP